MGNLLCSSEEKQKGSSKSSKAARRLKKSTAPLQEVLSFFEPRMQVQLQGINRLFYKKITTKLMGKSQCPLFQIGNVTKGYCLLSH
jgi:hypothetical protein